MAVCNSGTVRTPLLAALTGIGVLGAVVLSGCGSDDKPGSSSKSLSRSSLEYELNQLQGSQNNPFYAEVRGASCRGGIEVRNGATQICDVTTHGKTRTYTITVTDASDLIPHFGATPRN